MGEYRMTKLYPSYEEELTNNVMTVSESPTWLIEMGGTKSLRLRNFIFSKKKRFGNIILFVIFVSKIKTL